jgi:hypothetical protein
MVQVTMRSSPCRIRDTDTMSLSSASPRVSLHVEPCLALPDVRVAVAAGVAAALAVAIGVDVVWVTEGVGKGVSTAAAPGVSALP